jgi:hypothetical protein
MRLHALTRSLLGATATAVVSPVVVLALAVSIAVAGARPAARANVVTRAWKPDVVSEPEALPRAEVELPSRVSFNSPALQGLRVARPGPAGDLRDRVDVDALRLLELHRLAAIGRRPLLKRWRPGSNPFDFMTAPATAATTLLSVHVADPERWQAVVEAVQFAGACPCLVGSGPGRVPNGGELPGTPLLLGRNAGVPSDVDLNWSASCSPGGVDYAIYQGDIGSWFTRTPEVCSTGGALAATITPGSGSSYYLVVPLAARSEGSYGVDSSGVSRPPSSSPCRSVFTPDGCP